MGDATEERSKVQLVWNERRSGFLYLRPGITQVAIEINQLRKMVHSIEDQIEECIKHLFPPSMPLDVAMKLPWDELQASTSSTSSTASFLDHEEAWGQWRQSAVNQLTQAYLQIYGSSMENFNKLLELDKTFQTHIVTIIITNSGVPPRLSTLLGFAHRTSAQCKLNLVIRAAVLALLGGRQKMDTRAPGIRDFVLRALSPRVAKILTVYLGLVRQAIVEVMRQKSWYKESVDAYNTRLFATWPQNTKCQRKAHVGSWSMVHIVAAWHKCSEEHLGAKLSIVDMRQLVTGIYSEYFPGLLYTPEVKDTAAVLQGDHNAAITRNFYGRNNLQGDGMSAPDIQSFIQASRIWQALMQTVPVSQAWSQDILKSTCFDPDIKRAYALKLANHLVLPSFASCLSAIEVKDTLRDLLETLPFIFGPEVRARYICVKPSGLTMFHPEKIQFEQPHATSNGCCIGIWPRWGAKWVCAPKRS